MQFITHGEASYFQTIFCNYPILILKDPIIFIKYLLIHRFLSYIQRIIFMFHPILVLLE